MEQLIQTLRQAQDDLNALSSELFARRDETGIDVIRKEFVDKRNAIVSKLVLPPELANVPLMSNQQFPPDYEEEKRDTTTEHYIIELSEWVRQSARDYGSTLVRVAESL